MALSAELPTAERLDLAPGAPLPPLAEGDALALWLPHGTLREFLATHPALPQEVPVLVSATLGELERRDETGIGIDCKGLAGVIILVVLPLHRAGHNQHDIARQRDVFRGQDSNTGLPDLVLVAGRCQVSGR